jgi:transposase
VIPAGARVLVATKPVDFRKGAEGLATLVKDQMRLEPFSGVVFMFRAKRTITRSVQGHPQNQIDGLIPWAYPA